MKKISTVFSKLILYIIIVCNLLAWRSQYVLAYSQMQTLEKEITKYIEHYKDTTAALTAIVVQGGDILVHKTTGYADIERRIMADDKTVFEWGSCSKILIWVSVMQLVERGLIDLNANIDEYFPKDFKYPKSFDKPITMLNLMNHNAGFDDSYTDLMIHNPNKIPNLRQALEQANIVQVFPPGEIVAYSNYGSALAAYIVETISGIDYREYVIKNIFRPLGMHHTSIDPQQMDNYWVRSQREKVQGYTKDKKLIEPNLYTIPLYPVGSVIGTPDDFRKLLVALLSKDGDLLYKNKGTIDLMFKPTEYFPNTRIPRIAHGLFSMPSQSKVYGHGGNTMAFSSSMYLNREKQIGVLVMTNQWAEENFCLGIPDIVFSKTEYMEAEQFLESSSIWKGIYQPARLPYHGFSKIYGLLNRTKVETQGKYKLKTNKFYYSQYGPGIYVNNENYCIYSLDVYSIHPRFKKILSSAYTDLIYIPLYHHIFQWFLIIAMAIGIIFSIIFIILDLIRRRFSLITIQNLLNLILIINIISISKKVLLMTSYNSLRINFWISILYIFISISLCGYKIYKKRVIDFSDISSLVLFINLVYWEFYH